MIKRKLIYLFFSIILTSTIFSCSNNGILSQDDMVKVLHDLQVGEAILKKDPNSFRSKESKEAVMNGILKKYNISKADLDSSLAYYSDNVNLYLRVNDSVMSTLQKESEKVNEQIAARMSRKHRSINHSILPEFAYLTNEQSILRFEVDSFQIVRFPNFKVEFQTLLMKKGINANFSVAFVYPDTTLIEDKKITASENYKIEKPNRSERLKYVYGYVRLVPNEEIPDSKILLYDISVQDSLRVAKVDTLDHVKK